MRGGRELGHVGSDFGQRGHRDAFADAGDGAESGQDRAVGGNVDAVGELGDVRSELVDHAQMHADQERVVVAEPAIQGDDEFALLFRRLIRASEARASGSVVPATSASRIARPDTPRMSVATEDSLMPASSSTRSSRLISRTRSRIRVVRNLVRSRSSRIGSGGTKEPGPARGRRWANHARRRRRLAARQVPACAGLTSISSNSASLPAGGRTASSSPRWPPSPPRSPPPRRDAVEAAGPQR